MKQHSKLTAFLIPLLVGAVLLPVVYLGVQLAGEWYKFYLSNHIQYELVGGIAYGYFCLFLIAFYFLKRRYKEMTLAFLGAVLGAGLTYVVSVILFLGIICQITRGGC